ncbi:sigma-54-dependent transcriptional regulator [Oxalicibacterium solurbis]|uniref:Type 4 fimbriae expression regulatory protein PilR n=1 Tax=Oxalicibacterium solurbis TaxID=69280 RepID=A0A8J3F8K8_9BURK|nr:sigma-54 dependent transcriptional regulator [Oxalicibacterium solurbis]GGI53643.1 type 4 fimbriae expression regulatory protein PilR [Oxalicibacterium solurbis]
MTAPRILIVDDEADLRELLEITLVKMGLDVDSAQNLSAARDHLGRTEYALVLTDMRLPDGLGIDLVQEINTQYRNTPVAVITAFGSAENAVAALKAGAFDYLSKPVGLEQLRVMVRSALRISQTNQTGQISEASGNAARGEKGTAGFSSPRLIGQSEAMQALRAQIARLARSMAPVAISGESGSGKELAARDIHALSARSDKPFVAVNCGAIPEALMEAEFFGYRKGAFTGATDDRDGFFQAANGGTLMLDEVADLPLAMQVKLLRAIQERRVRKVGATAEEPVDVRIVSATHQNLHDCVGKGAFRQDLYYRLNVIELHLPPLRERLDDIGLLADVILSRLGGGHTAALTPEALEALRNYSFPGNVRELENILERALAFANDGVIEVGDLVLKASPPATAASEEVATVPAEFPTQPAVEQTASAAPAPSAESDLPESLPDHLDDVEREIIRRALAKTHFNRTQAAELLGISFRQLRYRMQRLDIHAPD